jgi:hypothetical protein
MGLLAVVGRGKEGRRSIVEEDKGEEVGDGMGMREFRPRLDRSERTGPNEEEEDEMEDWRRLEEGEGWWRFGPPLPVDEEKEEEESSGRAVGKEEDWPGAKRENGFDDDDEDDSSVEEEGPPAASLAEVEKLTAELRRSLMADGSMKGDGRDDGSSASSTRAPKLGCFDDLRKLAPQLVVLGRERTLAGCGRKGSIGIGGG